MAASNRASGGGPSKTPSPSVTPAGPGSNLAKLSRPRLYDALPRKRLFERLDELRRHPVVWVVGPPGAGKTTLVASYVEARGNEGLWYQVDAGDADVSTFFFYLSQAAAPFAQGKPDLPLFTPEYLPELSGFARRYFRELFSRLPQDCVLTLDNLQEVPDDSLFHQAILAALSEVPSHCNLIVISRSEPGLDYTRGVASREIAQLRWSELRLSLEETRVLSRARHQFSDPAVQSLHDRSDGWAAGLVLLLERADSEAPEAERIGLASREAVFDYFASIFFDRMPPRSQRTMMLCALVPSLTQSVAVGISADRDAGDLLEDLFHRQLFVQRIGAAEPTYGFHSLLREFLEAKARGAFSATELRAASLRAANAVEASGDVEQAYALFVGSQQWDDAVRLVLAHAPRLFAEGRWKTILDWIARLPRERAQHEPWLGYWVGISQFQFDQELSRNTLALTYRQFESSDNRLGQMLAAAAILTGYYFEYANWDTAEPWIFRLGDLLESHPAFPSRELELTVYSAMLYGIAIRRPDHPLLPVCIERTVALIENDLDTNARMLAGLAITGPVVCMLGAFDLFHRVRKILLPLLDDGKLTELNRAVWHMTNGTKLCLHAEYEEPYLELERGARLSAQFNLRQIEVLCHFFIGMHASCYFDVERSQLAMEALERIVNPLRPLERAHQLWCQGMYHTVAGNFTTAIARHEGALLAVESIGGAAHKLIGLILYSAPLVLAGRVADALAVAEEGLQFARACKLHTWDACFVMIQAWCRHEQGELAEADRLLDKAIEVAEDGTYRYFRWLLQGSRKMLAQALRRGIRSDAAGKMVRQFRYTSPDPLLESWPWPVKVRTLGTFAVEIDGQPLRFGRKTPKRLLSLLQCLIALGGHEVAEHKLADALWPAADGDEAIRRLTLSLHRLRQLLGNHESIRVSGGKISLNPERVWVDALCISHARERLASDAFQQIAVALYHGEFLEDEAQEPWLLPAREQLRALQAQAVRELADSAPAAQFEVNKK
jgi:LuxR family maltose regulon positive regulatory protein